MISDDVKRVLYEHATRHLEAEKQRGEKIVVEYDPVDVEHIAYWFKVDVQELDNYWRDYCGG
ncbi:MAG: hypothetical protein JTJ30_12735 [Catenibacterium mitsuokai]|nr:hypothetical protein [Catenibacterium mitsuokai]MBN2932832.1 hypothetical protein [Catenibacterium mitsuokai]